MMGCLKHKRYKAKLKPRCDCVECWRMFLDKTDNYQVVCQEMDSRGMNDISGTVIAEFDPGPNDVRLIMEMLVSKKKEFEQKYFERNNNGSNI